MPFRIVNGNSAANQGVRTGMAGAMGGGKNGGGNRQRRNDVAHNLIDGQANAGNFAALWIQAGTIAQSSGDLRHPEDPGGFRIDVQGHVQNGGRRFVNIQIQNNIFPRNNSETLAQVMVDERLQEESNAENQRGILRLTADALQQSYDTNNILILEPQ